MSVGGLAQDPFVDVVPEVLVDVVPDFILDIGAIDIGGGGAVFGQLIDNLDGTFTDPGTGNVFDASGNLIESGPLDIPGSGGWPGTIVSTTTVDPAAHTGVLDAGGTPINWGAILTGTIAIITAAGRMFGITGSPPPGYHPTSRPGTYVGPDGRLYTLNAQGQPVLASTAASGFGSLGMLALLAGGAFLLLRRR